MDSVELQSGVLLWSSTDASVVDVLRYFGLSRTPLWSSTDASVELLQIHYKYLEVSKLLWRVLGSLKLFCNPGYKGTITFKMDKLSVFFSMESEIDK